MDFFSIASGSSGNCICVGDDSTHVMIDAGISGKRIEAGMNTYDYTTADMDGLLVTHEHSDHVAGLDDLRPSNVFGDVNVYAEDYTAHDLQTRLPYCFVKEKYPGVPGINLQVVEPFKPNRSMSASMLSAFIMRTSSLAWRSSRWALGKRQSAAADVTVTKTGKVAFTHSVPRSKRRRIDIDLLSTPKSSSA